MKKLIISMILLLACISAISRDKYRLIIEGEFLNKKNVTYTVYKWDKDGNKIEEYTSIDKKYFTIVFSMGSKYSVEFKSENSTKTLVIDVLNSKVSQDIILMLDVDFSNTIGAHLTFNNQNYKIIPIESEIARIKP